MDTRFERSKGEIEYFTPPEILKPLGKFDLDPCSSEIRPWDTAKHHYTDEGLSRKWYGRIFLNPPYGNQTELWLKKLSDHGNGIALTYARTETKMFFKYIWGKATAILFLKGRLRFFDSSGLRLGSAGSPSVLIAYGLKNAFILKRSKIPGKFLWINKPNIFRILINKICLIK